MTHNDKAYAELARRHPDMAFKRGDTVVIWTSTCDNLPVCQPIVVSRVEATAMLYASISRYCKDTLAAIVTGESTCRSRKGVIDSAADLFGRSVRTIEKAIATIPST